jgi:glycosyltransferase involved in cell wall biosynthesis
MTVRPRMLVSFPFSEKGGWSIPLGEGCAAALQEIGFDVIRFNPVVDTLPKFPGQKIVERAIVAAGYLALQSKEETRRKIPWGEEAVYQRRILALARETRPDYLLVISAHTYSKQVLDRLKAEAGIKRLVGWCTEGPTWKRSPAEEAALYDSYYCIYPVDSDLRIRTISALAYDPTLYYLLTPRPEKDVDVAFVGRSKARRVEFLSAILDFKPLIYGPQWTRDSAALAPYLGGESIFGAELNRLYNRTKIVLNISNWDNEKTDCPNLRIVDVPASGSFLLSDYSASAAELFVPGKEIEFFHDTRELREKLAYYLANPEARERIARAGYAKARQLQTYRDKMISLLTASAIPIPGNAASTRQSACTS